MDRQMDEQENLNRGAKDARDFLSRVQMWMRGTEERTTYALTVALFLRALGVIYFVAFASLAVQVLGLYGSQGILPIADFIGRQEFSVERVWELPTLFWVNTSDAMIVAVPIVGALLSLALVFGLRYRVVLVALFVLYLSLVVVGQDFMAFQWDYFLLEVGFIAIFLQDSVWAVWLYRWLLFRLMFVSGLVKIFSGDPNWRNLTALDFHFETQPLPNVIGFFVHQLPSPVHQAMTAGTFVIELAVPFLIFAPRRLRFLAAGLIAVLQVQIFLTGNYNFFNLLTAALCVLLLDDAAVRGMLRAIKIAATCDEYIAARNLPAQVKEQTPSVPLEAIGKFRVTRWIANGVVILFFVVSGFQFLAMFRVPTPAIVEDMARVIAPLRVVNEYGPFAVMTTRRPEIIVEGSNDGVTWKEYEFRFKPGDVRRAPPWVEPHQPRLDWEMWFAALGARTSDPNSLLPSVRSNRALMFRLLESGADVWVVNFVVRLLEGSPTVLGLMDRNPFPDAPPKFVRARLFEYKFTDWDAPFVRGEWWVRADRGMYLDAMTLGE